MRVKVVAFASFREILGREMVLDLRDASTVKELLEGLAAGIPRFKEEAFDPSGALRDYVLLMVNKKRIDSQKDLAIVLEDGDELAVFPPLAGG